MFPRGPEREDNSESALRRLSEFRKRFDPVLGQFLNEEVENSARVQPELAEILRVGAEFVMNGGKRLRPAFLYYGYKAAGGEDEESILRAACCVELVHAGALIHDDIIDNSDLRRGSPTVHVSFGQKFGQGIGSSLAILTGDTVAAFAAKALNSFPAVDDRMKIARDYFDRMCIEINLGQYLDVLGGLSDKVDVDWVMKIMEYKTAGYTVEKPLLIGAALGGAPRETLEWLSGYAIRLGIAFQIQDDILGMFGDIEKVGKPVDSDLKEGKKTILVLKTKERLLETGRTKELNRFDSILGNPDLTIEDYEWVQGLMEETGAVGHCRSLANDLISASKGSLNAAGIDEEAREYLLGIADYMLTREY